MIFFRIVIFSLCLSGFPAFAQKEFKTFQKRFDQQLSMCLSKDFEPVKIHPVPDNGKKQYAHCWLFSAIGRHYIGTEQAFDPDKNPDPDKPVLPLDYLDSKIHQHLDDLKHLNDYEKVSFSKCLSSGLLNFSLENNKKWYLKSINSCLMKGYGCCRHFSKISSRILSHLNIDHQIVCSSNHAFVQVHVDDQWYLIEPQRNDSTFYQD